MDAAQCQDAHRLCGRVDIASVHQWLHTDWRCKSGRRVALDAAERGGVPQDMASAGPRKCGHTCATLAQSGRGCAVAFDHRAFAPAGV